MDVLYVDAYQPYKFILFNWGKMDMKKNNNFLVIRKMGLFYNVFDDDAQIISYLLGYRVINGRCGFPNNTYNKVINTLEDKKINYIIIDTEEIKKDFKNLNNYELYLAKSKNKNTLMHIIKEINEKIEDLPEDKLYQVLEYLKKLVDEQ